MKLKNFFRILFALIFSFLITACGGGTPAPATQTPTPSSELYFGFYTEDPTVDTVNPTPGMLYLTIPSTNGSFGGEFFFSYFACTTFFNTGLVAGNKSNNTINGTWSGAIDNRAESGTFNATNTGTKYTGTWTNDLGTKAYTFGNPVTCSYTVAGNGDFTLYQINQTPMAVAIDLTSPFTPKFNLTGNFPAGAALRLNVFDKACLANGTGISSCFMTEYNYFGGGTSPTSITYGSAGSSGTKILVSGNTYVVAAFYYGIFTLGGNGQVHDFGSNEFIVP